MTKNQNDFLANRENERHNREVEKFQLSQLGETKRHNISDERIRGYSASETARHNVRTEGQQDVIIGENSRHNRSVESETNRANIAQEALKRDANTISAQYNTGYLAELERHNRSSEVNQYISSMASQMSAEASQLQAEVARARAQVDRVSAYTNNLYTKARTDVERAQIDRINAEIAKWDEELSQGAFDINSDRLRVYVQAADEIIKLLNNQQSNFNGLLNGISRLVGGLQ